VPLAPEREPVPANHRCKVAGPGYACQFDLLASLNGEWLVTLHVDAASRILDEKLRGCGVVVGHDGFEPDRKAACRFIRGNAPICSTRSRICGFASSTPESSNDATTAAQTLLTIRCPVFEVRGSASF